MQANYDCNVGVRWSSLRQQRFDKKAIMKCKTLQDETQVYVSSKFIYRDQVTIQQLVI